ncbi:MAG TPA: MarR family transcriptional regulator [Coriobacteriia bacterium]|nr:MarR family transcriptional regulator [Coriobacteriia bacterium]
MTVDPQPQEAIDTTSVSPAALRVARVTAHTVPRIMGALAASMREQSENLHPAQMQVLMMMHAGALSPSELAERLEVSLPTISKTVSVLERRGWIDRSADEQDRRRVVLQLTGEGRATVRGVLAHGIEQLALTLSVATEEELVAIEAGMTDLQTVLSRAHETYGYRHCRTRHHEEESAR